MQPDPMDPNKTMQLHQIEQATALMAEVLPPLWKRLLDNCIEAGFDKDTALRLVMVQLHAQCGGKLSI